MVSSAANASHVILPDSDNCDDSAVCAKDYTHSLGALLSALSTVLGDTLGRFETISSRVTERVLSRGDAADHDLIVALQDFDRLQQEFTALGDVISYCADASSTGSNSYDTSLGHAAIAEITLTDLKDRFLRHLRNNAMDSIVFSGNEEQVF